MARTVMLIHGAWLTPRSWDRFKARYEAQGMTVTAPAWPLLDQPVEQLRRFPPEGLGRLGIRRIVDRYAEAIRDLPEPPILIGHCFGGLVAQLLLDRGLGACGVAICTAPPFGVAAAWTLLPLHNLWGGWRKPLPLSLAAFTAGFAQTLATEDAARAYAEHVVPAPGRIFFEGLLGIDCRVDYGNARRAPLLLIGGETDEVAPPALLRANLSRQKRAASRTDLQSFPGRSHWLCNEPGWEEAADFALDWAMANATVPEPAQGARL